MQVLLVKQGVYASKLLNLNIVDGYLRLSIGGRGPRQYYLLSRLALWYELFASLRMLCIPSAAVRSCAALRSPHLIVKFVSNCNAIVARRVRCYLLYLICSALRIPRSLTGTVAVVVAGDIQ